jgi:hypothetical protein
MCLGSGSEGVEGRGPMKRCVRITVMENPKNLELGTISFLSGWYDVVSRYLHNPAPLICFVWIFVYDKCYEMIKESHSRQ